MKTLSHPLHRFSLGIVSLFADVTYEGARGLIGPYLLLLGASGSAVGIIVGIGEFLGIFPPWNIRPDYRSDKTILGSTWIGYVINLVSVPLLALTNHWQTAACSIVLERVGKAIRVPARDSMLSFALKQTGRGWGFGLHEALDQIGAVVGPLSIAVLLYSGKSFQFGFAILARPSHLGVRYLGPSKPILS